MKTGQSSLRSMNILGSMRLCLFCDLWHVHQQPCPVSRLVAGGGMLSCGCYDSVLVFPSTLMAAGVPRFSAASHFSPH